MYFLFQLNKNLNLKQITNDSVMYRTLKSCYLDLSMDELNQLFHLHKSCENIVCCIPRDKNMLDNILNKNSEAIMLKGNSIDDITSAIKLLEDDDYYLIVSIHMTRKKYHALLYTLSSVYLYGNALRVLRKKNIDDILKNI